LTVFNEISDSGRTELQIKTIMAEILDSGKTKHNFKNLQILSLFDSAVALKMVKIRWHIFKIWSYLFKETDL